MMKKEITEEIQDIRSILDQIIYPLKEEYDPQHRLNYYWDVLEFIKWMKSTHPQKYDEYDLEYSYDQISHFGHYYSKIFESNPFGYDHGMLGIDKNIDDMITDLYEYVIALDETNTVQLSQIKQLIEHQFTNLNDKVDHIDKKVDPKREKFNTPDDYMKASIKKRLKNKGV